MNNTQTPPKPEYRMQNLLHSSFHLLPFFLLLGCSNPADNVPRAEVKTNTTAKNTAPKLTEAGDRTFAFGPEGSSIEFTGSKVTGSHNGGFKNFTGELKVANGKLVDADNKVVIDASSLLADNDRLTGHLKSPDFFGVAQFPTAVFVSTSIAPNTTNSTVTGNLTLHGVTKEISFPAKIDVSANAVAVAAQFAINRFDFGIVYKGMPNDLIRKEVVLKLNVNATPGKADFESVVKAAQAGAAAIPATAARPGGTRPGPGTAPTRPGGQQPRAPAR